MNADYLVLRDLARQYAAIAADPVQQQRREMWADHLSLRPTRPLVSALVGPWDAWLGEMLADANLRCRDPELRPVERDLRWRIMRAGWGADDVVESWISIAPVHLTERAKLWGVPVDQQRTHLGGAAKFDEPIRVWDDMRHLVPPAHGIDEAATAARIAKVEEALDGIIEVDHYRSPLCYSFEGDISTTLGMLHGIEQTMCDMVEDPDGLHRMIEFLRDGILANQQQAENAGDLTLTSHNNQAMTYCRELPWPKASTRATPDQLWYHIAAQEFTGVSPEMHEEFLLQYQAPIMRRYGLISYGCCEDLTKKIDMLRRIPNLRMIAVTPAANVGKCVDQIGTDYVVSWRPSPADTVCMSWDESRLRRILADGLATTRGTRRHILLKDVMSVEGDPDRMRRFCLIAREEAEKTWETEA